MANKILAFHTATSVLSFKTFSDDGEDARENNAFLDLFYLI